MAIDSAARPMRADARRNREKILAAARIVLARDGMQAQMDDIAAAAGVGVGTVYRHFPTKEALAAELVAERFRRFKEHMDEALAAAQAGADPFDALAGALTRNAELCAADVALQDALMRASDDVLALAMPALDALRTVTGELIALAKAAHRIRPDMRVEDVPLVMTGLGASMSAACPFCGPEDWRRHLAIILDGLRVTA